MKHFLLLGIIGSVACSEHKVNLLDSRSAVANCTLAAECEIEQINDSDYYDLEDEDVYKQYLIEACVDEINDGYAIAKEFKCGSEYRAMMKCNGENYIDSCDYDDDEWEDLMEDQEKIANETCWTVNAAYEECMDW